MSAIHAERHPLAGQTVTIGSGAFAGSKYQIEDWYDRVAGISWACREEHQIQVIQSGKSYRPIDVRNEAADDYSARAVITDHLPLDDEVLYGKIDGRGKLVHVSQITEGEGA